MDAVKTFGRFLEHRHLERAYDRAGPYFTGIHSLQRVSKVSLPQVKVSFLIHRAFGDGIPGTN